jgi:hypothetical protein
MAGSWRQLGSWIVRLIGLVSSWLPRMNPRPEPAACQRDGSLFTG